MPIIQNDVKSKMSQVFKGISDKKAPAFIHAVLSDAGIISKEKAPIEFGTLVNSQRQDVDVLAGRVVGELSYSTDYAIFLNTSKKWKPRPPDKKAGNAWNPNATSGFLEWGFESEEARRLQQKRLGMFRV